MKNNESGLLPVATLVIWTGCLIVGSLGLLIPYAHPHASPQTLPPVQAELLNVEIAQDRDVLPQAGPPIAGPPPASEALAMPAAPSLIAFAEPVAEPPRPATVANTPAVQHLIYGQGEGEQPAPEYPRESIIARQQGLVVVRFVVDENGRVQTAEAVTPSSWPLLNQAAIRAVRDTWHFPAGRVRSYEVSIQFELRQRSQ